jgi:hypothetical protein
MLAGPVAGHATDGGPLQAAFGLHGRRHGEQGEDESSGEGGLAHGDLLGSTGKTMPAGYAARCALRIVRQRFAV